MNDRDEQHYDHEESEYHFSDDDVSYEVETEASKPVAPEPDKKNPLGGLTQSKRMIISLVVFLGLVFVVYKMVSPGSSAPPSTDINPVAVNQAPAPAIAPPPLPHTEQATTTQTVPIPAQADTTTPVASAPAVQAQAPTAETPMAAAPQAAAATTQAPATTPATTTVMPAPNQPAPAQPAPQIAQAPTAPQSPVGQPMVAPVAVQSAAPAQPQPSAIPPAPLTTPVAAAPVAPAPMAAAPQAPQTAQPIPVATTVVSTPTVTPTNTDATIAAMAATNEKLINQLQAEYSQKVTDFSNQNKALQDQMQSLNARVAGLESQLGQLVQTLTRQTGMGGTTSLNVVPAQQPPPPPIVEQPRIRYNVQAIIPGRAWLKSDNGETLTVAEGDSIRELGKVTKIDPYDGIVEVNTGSRTVSISYGSGG